MRVIILICAAAVLGRIKYVLAANTNDVCFQHRNGNEPDTAATDCTFFDQVCCNVTQGPEPGIECMPLQPCVNSGGTFPVMPTTLEVTGGTAAPLDNSACPNTQMNTIQQCAGEEVCCQRTDGGSGATVVSCMPQFICMEMEDYVFPGSDSLTTPMVSSSNTACTPSSGGPDEDCTQANSVCCVADDGRGCKPVEMCTNQGGSYPIDTTILAITEGGGPPAIPTDRGPNTTTTATPMTTTASAEPSNSACPNSMTGMTQDCGREVCCSRTDEFSGETVTSCADLTVCINMLDFSFPGSESLTTPPFSNSNRACTPSFGGVEQDCTKNDNVCCTTDVERSCKSAQTCLSQNGNFAVDTTAPPVAVTTIVSTTHVVRDTSIQLGATDAPLVLDNDACPNTVTFTVQNCVEGEVCCARDDEHSGETTVNCAPQSMCMTFDNYAFPGSDFLTTSPQPSAQNDECTPTSGGQSQNCSATDSVCCTSHGIRSCKSAEICDAELGSYPSSSVQTTGFAKVTTQQSVPTDSSTSLVAALLDNDACPSTETGITQTCNGQEVCCSSLMPGSGEVTIACTQVSICMTKHDFAFPGSESLTTAPISRTNRACTPPGGGIDEDCTLIGNVCCETVSGQSCKSAEICEAELGTYPAETTTAAAIVPTTVRVAFSSKSRAVGVTSTLAASVVDASAPAATLSASTITPVVHARTSANFDATTQAAVILDNNACPNSNSGSLQSCLGQEVCCSRTEQGSGSVVVSCAQQSICMSFVDYAFPGSDSVTTRAISSSNTACTPSTGGPDEDCTATNNVCCITATGQSCRATHICVSESGEYPQMTVTSDFAVSRIAVTSRLADETSVRGATGGIDWTQRQTTHGLQLDNDSCPDTSTGSTQSCFGFEVCCSRTDHATGDTVIGCTAQSTCVTFDDYEFPGSELLTQPPPSLTNAACTPSDGGQDQDCTLNNNVCCVTENERMCKPVGVCIGQSGTFPLETTDVLLVSTSVGQYRSSTFSPTNDASTTAAALANDACPTTETSSVQACVGQEVCCSRTEPGSGSQITSCMSADICKTLDNYEFPGSDSLTTRATNTLNTACTPNSGGPDENCQLTGNVCCRTDSGQACKSAQDCDIENGEYAALPTTTAVVSTLATGATSRSEESASASTHFGTTAHVILANDECPSTVSGNNEFCPQPEVCCQRYDMGRQQVEVTCATVSTCMSFADYKFPGSDTLTTATPSTSNDACTPALGGPAEDCTAFNSVCCTTSQGRACKSVQLCNSDGGIYPSETTMGPISTVARTSLQSTYGTASALVLDNAACPNSDSGLTQVCIGVDVCCSRVSGGSRVTGCTSVQTCKTYDSFEFPGSDAPTTSFSPSTNNRACPSTIGGSEIDCTQTNSVCCTIGLSTECFQRAFCEAQGGAYMAETTVTAASSSTAPLSLSTSSRASTSTLIQYSNANCPSSDTPGQTLDCEAAGQVCCTTNLGRVICLQADQCILGGGAYDGQTTTRPVSSTALTTFDGSTESVVLDNAACPISGASANIDCLALPEVAVCCKRTSTEGNGFNIACAIPSICEDQGGEYTPIPSTMPFTGTTTQPEASNSACYTSDNPTVPLNCLNFHDLGVCCTHDESGEIIVECLPSGTECEQVGGQFFTFSTTVISQSSTAGAFSTSDQSPSLDPTTTERRDSGPSTKASTTIGTDASSTTAAVTVSRNKNTSFATPLRATDVPLTAPKSVSALASSTSVSQTSIDAVSEATVSLDQTSTPILRTRSTVSSSVATRHGVTSSRSAAATQTTEKRPTSSDPAACGTTGTNFILFSDSSSMAQQQCEAVTTDGGIDFGLAVVSFAKEQAGGDFASCAFTVTCDDMNVKIFFDSTQRLDEVFGLLEVALDDSTQFEFSFTILSRARLRRRLVSSYTFNFAVSKGAGVSTQLPSGTTETVTAASTLLATGRSSEGGQSFSAGTMETVRSKTESTTPMGSSIATSNAPTTSKTTPNSDVTTAAESTTTGTTATFDPLLAGQGGDDSFQDDGDSLVLIAGLVVGVVFIVAAAVVVVVIVTKKKGNEKTKVAVAPSPSKSPNTKHGSKQRARRKAKHRRGRKAAPQRSKSIGKLFEGEDSLSSSNSESMSESESDEEISKHHTDVETFGSVGYEAASKHENRKQRKHRHPAGGKTEQRPQQRQSRKPVPKATETVSAPLVNGGMTSTAGLTEAQVKAMIAASAGSIQALMAEQLRAERQASIKVATGSNRRKGRGVGHASHRPKGGDPRLVGDDGTTKMALEKSERYGGGRADGANRRRRLKIAKMTRAESGEQMNGAEKEPPALPSTVLKSKSHKAGAHNTSPKAAGADEGADFDDELELEQEEL
eukprot:INCI721.1.p1 GENE.INCI721.1~~INCI721.1.p1  ORF type:complete len:2348 (+),score=348.85 INCI721.1:126-7169(+)